MLVYNVQEPLAVCPHIMLGPRLVSDLATDLTCCLHIMVGPRLVSDLATDLTCLWGSGCGLLHSPTPLAAEQTQSLPGRVAGRMSPVAARGPRPWATNCGSDAIPWLDQQPWLQSYRFRQLPKSNKILEGGVWLHRSVWRQSPPTG